MACYSWNKKDFGKDFIRLLETVSERYPARLAEDEGAKKLLFRKTKKNGLKVSYQKDSALIEAGTLASFARGLGFVFAGLEAEETTDFESLGVMIDCSRNKVFRPEYLKEYLTKMALMGGNLAMLYTEDTYVLPGEPYFGYMRGGYTMEDLQDLDAFAKKLGIELVGCIQTLGHLGEIFQHPAYGEVRDTANVLMVDEPKTYKLIEKMVSFWRKALSSKRIHIGMDETHDLGRGRFLDLKGYEKAPDLFQRHLAKVNKICMKYDLKPIIWSDMYFRLANPQMDYYYENPQIPESIKAGIPKNVQLCYWDYYHDNAAFYEKFIECHRGLGSEPILGSGIWTWSKFWCDMDTTIATVVPCIEACRKTKLKEIFFTMWGDNGGYCMYDSSLAGLELACGLAYGEKVSDDDLYQKRFAAVCGEDYSLFREAAAIHKRSTGAISEKIAMPGDRIFWEDPMLGADAVYCEFAQKGCVAEWMKALKVLSARLEKETDLSDSLHAVQELADVIIRRLEFRKALLAAYAKKDRAALRKLAMDVIPGILSGIDAFSVYFRSDWMRTARPFGLEVIQRRVAGLEARFEELQTRILEFLNGKYDRIEELDAALQVEKIVRETGFTTGILFSGSNII